MAQIHHLFVISTPTQTSVTEGPPDSNLEVPPYSLLEVIPNSDGTEIKKIQCMYVFGLDDSDSLYRAYDKPNIHDMITGGVGRNLLQKIIACIKSEADLSDEDEQDLLNSFVAGIVITMFAYCAARYDACDVGDPYYPIEIILPDEARAVDSEVELLTESMYEHYSQGAKVVLFTDVITIGSQWAKEITSFWNNWGHCFDSGPTYDCMDSMYRAVTSCLQYLVSSKYHQTGDPSSHIAKSMENHASLQIARMCEAKEKFGCSVDVVVAEHHKKLTKLYDDMVSELDEVRVTAYEDVTSQSTAALDSIETGACAAKAKLIKDQEALLAKLQSQLAVHANELTENLKSELKVAVKQLVDQKLERYIERAVERVDDPVSAKVREMSKLVETCRTSAREAKQAASEAKQTATRRKQLPRKSVPRTPDEIDTTERIARLENKIRELESRDYQIVTEQLSKINRVLRL